jgi:anti-anti-sigma factor
MLGAHAGKCGERADEGAEMESNDVVIRRDADASVGVLLLRRITGEASEDAMWQALAAAADPENHRPLILDFEQVQHVSSLGLGRLLTLAKQCRESQTPLVIRGLCPTLKHLFEFLRIDVLLGTAGDGEAGRGNAT